MVYTCFPSYFWATYPYRGPGHYRQAHQSVLRMGSSGPVHATIVPYIGKMTLRRIRQTSAKNGRPKGLSAAIWIHLAVPDSRDCNSSRNCEYSGSVQQELSETLALPVTIKILKAAIWKVSDQNP